MSGTIQTGTQKINGVSTDYNFPDPLGTVQTLTDMDVDGVQTDYNRGPAEGTIEAKTHKINGVSTTYFIPNVTGFGSSSGGGGPVIPLPIQLGAKMWHSYTDPAKIIEGATAVNIAGWTDETGTYDLAQATPANQPTYNVDKADFDGGDSLTTGVSTIGTTGLFADVGEAWTVTVVGVVDTEGYLISKADQASSTKQFGIVYSSNVLKVQVRGLTTNLTHSYTKGDKVTISVTWDGTTCLVYVDDDAPQTIGVGTDVANTLPIQIGQRVGGFNLIGTMHQNLIFDTTKTPTEIAQLKTYLEGL